MRFRYYITDPIDGTLTGTDSEEVAKNFAMCTDYYVLDSELGLWMVAGEDEADDNKERCIGIQVLEYTSRC